ncbi:MAG: hypothetical protein MK293_14140 [Pedosphaera sp.]|nr:hypothetical protein [Pedosphaera sp.]
MQNYIFTAFLAIGLILNSVGCKKPDPAAENRTQLESQWKIQTEGLVNGNKDMFVSVLSTDTAAAPVKVNFAFNAVHGLAKLAKFTTASLRIDDVQFTADFTQATVKTAHVDTNSPSGWKPFPKPENWIKEGDQWKRQF